MTRPEPAGLARSALLLGLALLIAKLFATGQMALYMSPALDPLTALAAVVLAGMGAFELCGARRGHTQHAGVDQTLTYLLVLAPLLLGLFVAPRALGSSALAGEPISSLILAFAREANPAPAVVATQPIDDVGDLLRFLRRAGEGGVGQRLHAVGLVARSSDLEGAGANEFVLLRYAVVHCVADARPIALLVVAPGAAVWPTDQWVEIDGSLGLRERDGERLVSIIADRIAPTQEPSNPYLQAI